MLLTNETIFSTIVSLKKWAKAFIAGENYSLLQWTSFLFENTCFLFKTSIIYVLPIKCRRKFCVIANDEQSKKPALCEEI